MLFLCTTYKLKIFKRMRVIEINTVQSHEILEQLNIHLNGDLKEHCGEHSLVFENEFGKGVIRSITFDWGVSLIDYNVCFTKDVRIIFKSSDINPIKFIFVSEGNLKYYNDDEDTEYDFERYQNIITCNKKNSKETYLFLNKTTIKVNFIYMQPKEYVKKKNNNLSYLNINLLSTFLNEKAESVYNHFGDFNLKIADQIKQLQEICDNGIVRTLFIEGQLNRIMAMQILELNNFEDNIRFPESISRSDIKKINNLSSYIVNNISEPMSITSLSTKSGLNPKKLQLGFKILFSKTVNEYVRQIKLETARDYIKNTNDSVSEIVYKVGFKSRSYFSKIFFEKYGVLPIDYRKKIKSK